MFCLTLGLMSLGLIDLEILQRFIHREETSWYLTFSTYYYYDSKPWCFYFIFLGWCFWFVLKVVLVIGSAVDRLFG